MAKMVIKMLSKTEAQVTKAFAKNAVIFGTDEYKLWKEYRKDFPDAKMVTRQKFLLLSSTPRNSKRFTKIFIPRFFVRHVQDVFQSVHEILLSWFKNEPREKSS